MSEAVKGDMWQVMPAAGRAIRLAAAREKAVVLARVRKWIDETLPPEARPLLVAMWRARISGAFGWRWVARELRLGVIQCRARWDGLIDRLTDWMNN